MSAVSSLVKTVAKKAVGKVALPVSAAMGAIDIAKVGKATYDISKANSDELDATNKMIESQNASARKNAERRTKARSDAQAAQEKINASQQTAPSSGATSRSSSLVKSDPLSRAIDTASERSQDAANDAEKAQRKAAENRYNEQVRAAEDAKGSAAGQYQWIIDTLGANKKDLLTKVAMSEGEGISNFDMQEKNTTEKYDSARQEILNTYRDLNRNQEKILRGSGTAQSSRSQEATLRLNGLLGKDLSTISKNEADSLALIGSALTTFKNKVLAQKDAIESETKSKLDKAALEYDDQIKAIDQNIYSAKNQKTEAFAQAEADLSEKVAAIKQWEAGLKLQAEQSTAKLKEGLDSFILDMTDSNGKLNAGLNEKIAATNEAQRAAGRTELEMNDPSILENTVGQYRKIASKYKTLEELQDAINRGEIDPAEAEQERSKLALAPVSTDPFKKDPLSMAMAA